MRNLVDHLPFGITFVMLFLISTTHVNAVTMNVARYGTGTQSTTRVGPPFQGDLAQYALDGNTDGTFNNGSVTHTENVANSFWEVNLDGDRTLDEIVLFNRADCCGDRLGNFRLSVFDGVTETFGQDFAGSVAEGGSQAFVLPGVTGDRVRVQLNGFNNEGNGVLSLAEVLIMSDVGADDPILSNGRNVARLGSASQSSTREGAPKGNQAILAIDGNTDGDFFNGQSVTHTLGERTPSWMVELNDDFNIDNIVINERTDCCNDRLFNFNVSVLDDTMSTVFTTTIAGQTGTQTFIPVDFGSIGRYVKIDLNDTGANRTLELAEVQVFGGERANVARNPLAVASQSSTRVGGGGNTASVAIDGITDGVFFGNDSVTHTTDARDSFWEVDLGDVFRIEDIVLFNRADCCGDRLSNFRVSIFDGLDEVFGQNYFEGSGSVAQGGRLDIPVLTIGDRVRIQLLGLNNEGNGVLSLAEVQVWGQPIPEPSTAFLMLTGVAATMLARRRRLS